jgi:hypothetical protein
MERTLSSIKKNDMYRVDFKNRFHFFFCRKVPFIFFVAVVVLFLYEEMAVPQYERYSVSR